MHPVVAIALCDLPLVGQQALAKHSAGYVKAALASSNLTSASILDRLLEDDPANDGAVAGFAVTRTTLNKYVTRTHPGKTDIRTYQYRNPLMPAEILTTALSSSDSTTALSAYCNPTTPEWERRKLTAYGAQTLTDYSVMRSFLLVAANLWMMEEPEKWGVRIRLAMTWQPEAPTETLQKLATISPAQGWGGERGYGQADNVATAHPAFHGRDINTLTVEQLLAADSIAATTAAVRRSELTLENARQILGNRVMPAPHIIGALVNRYGASTLLAATGDCAVWITADCTTARFIAYAIHYSDAFSGQDCKEAIEAVDILEDNQQHWEAFTVLTTDWHGNLVEAAQAACRL